MWSMQKAETLFFEILFVMTETVGPASNLAFQKTLFLYWIDLAQVLRVMTSEPYGWSEQSYNLIKFFDLVYVFADLVAKVIPRYSLFILASFLVMLALADTAYAAKLFSTATKVQTMWPIKLLKFLVGTTVTILFSSVLKWLIIPIECEVSREKSLSSYLHGDGAPCTPWAFPDAFFSSFTMIAVVMYSCFAFTVSLLAFETNPLRRGVQAQSTGRVEACWIAIKVTVTMFTYVTNWIGSLPCAIFINAAMLFLCYYHNSLLPFHRHETNLIRGGVFAFTTWLSFATVIVSATEVPQPHQWGLLAFAPVFFVVGICLTHYRRTRIDVTIERLRAEFVNTIPAPHRDTLRTRRRRSTVAMHSPRSPGGGPSGSAGNEEAPSGSAALQRFFDPTWESRKAFASESRAMVVLRSLLYRREKADLPLLLWLAERAMEEYPDSVSLRIFELLIVRFVKENHTESNALEKKYQMDRKTLAVDYRYALFALERAKIKESAGANLGKGMYSVINVMEFDAGMERSKNGHMECIVGLKKFWAQTSNMEKSGDNQKLMLQEMVKEVKALDTVIDGTRQEYKTLVELYPTSNTLLRTYALFCETILNDAEEAEKWRSKADALDDSEDGSEGLSGSLDPQEEERKDQMGDNKSSGSGLDTASSKNKALLMWKDILLKGECEQVKMLHRYIRLGLVLMLVCSLGSYITMNRVVLNNVLGRMGSIQTTLKFTMSSSMSVYLLREMQLTAKKGGGESDLEVWREEVVGYMTELQLNHKHLYETHSEMRSTYNDPSMLIREPLIRGGWQTRNDSFWNLNIEYARRVQRAAATTAAELVDDNFRLQDISDEKRNVAFVFENTERNMMPWYLEMLAKYTRVVQDFVSFAWMLVQLASAVSPTLLVLVSGLVLWKLRKLIPQMQSKRMSVIMALRFPRRVQHKLSEFYNRLQHEMLEIEDEERCWEAIQDGGGEEEEEEEEGESSSTEKEAAPLWWQAPVEPQDASVPVENGEKGAVSRPSAKHGAASALTEEAARDCRPEERMVQEGGEGRGRTGQAATRREKLSHALDKGGGDAGALTEKNVREHISRESSTDRLSEASLFRSSKRSLQQPDEKWTGLERIESASDGKRGADGGCTADAALELAGEDVELRVVAAEGEAGAQLTDDGAEAAELNGAKPESEAEEAEIETKIETKIEPIVAVQVEEEGADGKQADSKPLLAAQPGETPGQRKDADAQAAVGNGFSGMGNPDALQKSFTHDAILDHTPRIPSPRGRARRSSYSAGATRGRRPSCQSAYSAARASHASSSSALSATRARRPSYSSVISLDGGDDGAQQLSEGKGRLQRSRSTRKPGFFAQQQTRGSFKGRRGRAGHHASFGDDCSDGSGSGRRKAPPAPRHPFKRTASSASRASRALNSPILKSFRGLPGSVQHAGVDGDAVVEHDKLLKRAMMLEHMSRSSKLLAGSGSWKRYRQDCEASVRWQEGAMVERRRQAEKPCSPMTPTGGALRSISPAARSRGLSVESCEDVKKLREENLELTVLTDEMLRNLEKEMLKHRGWHTRTDVWVCVLFVLVGLFLFSTLYPVRILPDVVDLILILDHGGRRKHLMQKCVFWAQELVLDDGFSRAHAWEAAASLEGALTSLRREHEAVRLGGDYGIDVGADLRFSKHNEVMYEPGCGWRKGGKDAGGCEAVVRPEARKYGLHHLLVTFLDAGRAVLHKYAPLDYQSRAADERNEAEFELVRFNSTRVATSDTDTDMAFMRQEARGDLVEGLTFVQDLFNDEATGILNRALMENNILFAVYSLAIIAGWYSNLFRSVIKSAFLEASRAQRFVARLPLMVLSKQETRAIESYFQEQQASAAGDGAPQPSYSAREAS